VTLTGTGIALRAATPADRDFLAGVYASTRETEMLTAAWTADQRAAFVAQQFAAQSHHYATYYGDASHDVVLADGEPAGRLIVDRRDDELHVIDIALLPEFRSRGIGTHLLRLLLEEAAARDVRASLTAERTNPALRLYRRLGFVQVGDNGVYVTLEVPPRGAQAKTAS
jgi:ribosomal protein S18 acetylase RimI-like enzyme